MVGVRVVVWEGEWKMVMVALGGSKRVGQVRRAPRREPKPEPWRATDCHWSWRKSASDGSEESRMDLGWDQGTRRKDESYEN